MRYIVPDAVTGKGGACRKVDATANLDRSWARRRERSPDRDEETDSYYDGKKAPPCSNLLTKKAPYKGLGADSEEKRP